MDRRIAPALIAVLLATSASVFGSSPAETVATQSSRSLDEKLFFSMSIADDEGTILAEPKLLGVCGVPVEMTLSEPGKLEMPRMSLVLQPEWQRDGSYEIAFELTIPGRLSKGRGSFRLFPGEEKSTLVSYPGGHFAVQLAAFTVPSQEFDLFLQHGAAKTPQPSRT